jgi:hypothetical protein
MVGLLLVVLWLRLGTKASWWLQVLMVAPGLVLLCGNLGLFVDAGHTLPLAIHLGLRATWAQIAARSPALITVVVLALLLRRPARLLEIVAEPSLPGNPTLGKPANVDADN